MPRDRREHDRRSIYLIAKRNLRLPFMETFDRPTLLTSCARRESSTHAPQALELLNGTLVERPGRGVRRAGCEREAGGDPAAHGRAGLPAGRSAGRRRRGERSCRSRSCESSRCEEFALALFNLNEFLYVP